MAQVPSYAVGSVAVWEGLYEVGNLFGMGSGFVEEWIIIT
jgi:hypothetical protein